MARPLGTVPEPLRSELAEAAADLNGTLSQAEEKTRRLRDRVLAASAAGGSVREIAVLTGKSTNTIQRWLKEQ
ncbi:HTH DNA binding protein [Mycobacterium phage Ibhubesi]|uniref:Helix-turn-helix DNA binding domain protein n=2 Tax=Cheoctovirus TaxID=1623281 RepID=A0A346FBY0_9CAUD|nr:HTH DNA binding protein [Mycobacterium phage Ibhubesi]YP_009957863.1 HTH DNA binding protein [Mycobacterium phage Harley]AEK09137.1 hypothetical protein PBI_IBHUBESI_41 [Mycobacterium phage Ibhubesi]AXN53205.1 hypothetical protein PBI_HARLEY_42 [Mycobacterium phage Harley]